MVYLLMIIAEVWETGFDTGWAETGVGVYVRGEGLFFGQNRLCG